MRKALSGISGTPCLFQANKKVPKSAITIHGASDTKYNLKQRMSFPCLITEKQTQKSTTN